MSRLQSNTVSSNKSELDTIIFFTLNSGSNMEYRYDGELDHGDILSPMSDTYDDWLILPSNKYHPATMNLRKSQIAMYAVAHVDKLEPFKNLGDDTIA